MPRAGSCRGLLPASPGCGVRISHNVSSEAGHIYIHNSCVRDVVGKIDECIQDAPHPEGSVVPVAVRHVSPENIVARLK